MRSYAPIIPSGAAWKEVHPLVENGCRYLVTHPNYPPRVVSVSPSGIWSVELVEPVSLACQ